MIINKLYVLLKQKKITQQELADGVEMSTAGLIRSFQNETLQVKKLFEISDFLGVDINFWFDGNTNKLTTNERKLIDSLREFIKGELK